MKSLLAFVTLLVFLFSGPVRADDPVKALQKRGAKIDFDDKGEPVQLWLTEAVDADLELIKELTSLETVGFSGTKVTPVGLKHLTKLKQLHTLHYGREQITDDSLHELIQLGLAHKLNLAYGFKGRPQSSEDVKWLYLRGVKLTDKGIKDLVIFKNLQLLDLEGGNWTAAGLKALAPLKSLTELVVSPITDDILKALREVGMLHALPWARIEQSSERPKSEDEVTTFQFHGHGYSIDYQGVTGAGVRELAGLPNLERLDLSLTHLTHRAMKDVATLKSLKWLALGDHVANEGLKDLTGLPLHTLALGYESPVTDAGMKEIGKIKSLQSLSLGGAKISAAGLKELKGLELYNLRLRRDQITDETLRVLREMDMLMALCVPQTRRRPEAPRRWLNISGAKITDTGLKELTGLTGLKGISLHDTMVTGAGVAELKKALPGLEVAWDRPPQPPAKNTIE